jgi:hypothetical protein
VTMRAILIAMILSVVSIYWQHLSSVIEGGSTLYALSTPPVPAIFCILLLIGAAPLLGRVLGKPLSKQELIVIFMFLVLAIPQVTWGVTEILLPWMTTHVYFATPQNDLHKVTELLPKWYYPSDPDLIREMYEGSADGSVPWKPWLYPLGMWTILMTLMFFTGMCLVSMFRKQWADRERLRFPLLLLPISLVEKESPGSHVPFFRNPLVWIAFVLVFTHHILNVMNAYNPSVSALKDFYRIGAIFTEEPWTAYYNVRFFYRPQVLGLAYFVSPDLLFSTWFSFLMQPTSTVIADVFGLRQDPSFPFSVEQGSGAFLAMLFVLFWVSRGQLALIARKALTGDPSIDDSDERIPYRWSFFGAIGGFTAIIIWSHFSGFSPVFSIPYVFLLLGFGLVYSRVRAEGGIPAVWAFPFNEHKRMMFQILGTRRFVRGGDASDLVMLASYSWMGRGYFTSQMGYQIENEALSDHFDIRTRRYGLMAVLAFVVGAVVAYYATLSSYYKFGAVTLGGGTTAGGGNVSNARTQWEEIVGYINNPTGPSRNRNIAISVGAAVTLAMVALRFFWLQSPFHPLGYAISLNYGYALWSNFMLVWIVKSAVQRLGGARLYRQLMPFFLGLVIADLVAGGLSWLILLAFGPRALAGYVVQF